MSSWLLKVTSISLNVLSLGPIICPEINNNWYVIDIITSKNKLSNSKPEKYYFHTTKCCFIKLNEKKIIFTIRIILFQLQMCLKTWILKHPAISINILDQTSNCSHHPIYKPIKWKSIPKAIPIILKTIPFQQSTDIKPRQKCLKKEYSFSY